MRNILLGLVALCWITGPAFADDGCQTPKTPYDHTYCLAKLFIASDDELNAVYKKLQSVLKPAQKSRLVEVQRHWISFRDTACSTQGTINVECNYQVNNARVTALRDRLRECKTGHCREDLLFIEDWTGLAH